jgi:hypothetical protein
MPYGGFFMQYVYDFWEGMTTSMVPLALVLTWVSLFFTVYMTIGIIRAVVALRKRKRRERAQRMAQEKRMQYTLPQSENEYVRMRLQSALRVEKTEAEGKWARVRLGYARVLWGKVKGAPLTVAERLQIEEMGKVFTLYHGKEVWTVEELRGLNDLCAALLKLSAKYAV